MQHICDNCIHLGVCTAGWSYLKAVYDLAYSNKRPTGLRPEWFEITCEKFQKKEKAK